MIENGEKTSVTDIQKKHVICVFKQSQKPVKLSKELFCMYENYYLDS